jgi:hypothetical protein
LTSMAAQLSVLYREMKNLVNRPDQLEYFDSQNTLDLITILVSIGYSIDRVISPSPVTKDVDFADQEYTVMLRPAFHFTILTLTLIQW